VSPGGRRHSRGLGCLEHPERPGCSSTHAGRRDPGDQIAGDAAFCQDAGQGLVVNIIETGLDVQEKRVHLYAQCLQHRYVIDQCEGSIVRARPREGDTLVGVYQAPRAGGQEEAGGDYPLKYLHDCAEEHNYPK